MSQHLEALERANEIRSARAALKREIHEHPSGLLKVLRTPPEWLRAERVGRLLRYAPGLGPQRTRNILASIPVGEMRTVGNLTDRERAALLFKLGERTRIGAA
jgi:hypothetical protein